MSQKISGRQQEILASLLAQREGLSVDDLAAALGISRTAVQQHFVGLEAEGYIKKILRNKTAGRPVTLYGITDKGINQFPKQYAWFAALMVDDLRDRLGEAGLADYLQVLGQKLAGQLQGGLVGKNLPDRLRELLKIMSDLGFQASLVVDADPVGRPEIIASNCIYHDVAQQHPELCQFDLALMSTLLAAEVDHRQCMAKGDGVCRFAVGKAEQRD